MIEEERCAPNKINNDDNAVFREQFGIICRLISMEMSVLARFRC